MSEPVSILVVARDQFSSVQPCLENLIAQTPANVQIHALIGGTPRHLRDRWARDLGERVAFHFEDRFLHPAEARNMGLRLLETPLAVILEADVFVRPGWLEPLLSCHEETRAAMVVPLILERPRLIHCAGCDLYITHENGVAYGHKGLRLWQLPFGDSCNLERSRTDYGELHCQLVEVEPALRLGVYDPKLMEVGEVDSGLTWHKAGLDMWFEPDSVVHFVEDAPLHADDIRYYAWRWDMHAILEGYRHFERKWSLDISEHGDFRLWLYKRNARLGVLPRLFPNENVLKLSQTVYRAGWKLRRLIGLPDEAMDSLRKRYFGYYEWPELEASRENHRQTGHPDLR